MSFADPRPVSPGSKLAVVAPAGPFNPETFEAGVAWLRERYEVVFDPGIFEKTGYHAGSDARRLAELVEAIDEPSVDAIICARGGFGATKLLPGLDLEKIRTANKLIVGFSDITALHSLWAIAGLKSLHGPMVASLGRATPEIRENWIDALEHRIEPGAWDLEALSGGSAEGRFFGGNLAVLGALIGTPFAPPLDGVILFIEDVGERPYRIDRMLTTFSQAGWFDRISGIVLGAFTEGEPGPDGMSVEDVFASHFCDVPFPVLAGLPAGHIDNNLPLPFGGTARIEDGRLSLSY